MKIDDALRGVNRLYLDSAPVIFYVEKNPTYLDRVNDIFGRIDDGRLEGIVSVTTLAEVLVLPLRAGFAPVVDTFVRLLTQGQGMSFVALGVSAALKAADVRARYNLALADALQVAAALEAGCDALLTNDRDLKWVTEIRIVVVDDLEI